MNFFKKKQTEPKTEPDISTQDEEMMDVGTEEGGELFENLETSDNGLFDGLDTVTSPLSSIKHKNTNLQSFGPNTKLGQDSGEDEDDYDEDDDDDEDVTSHPIEGLYDPAEFSDLPVSEEVTELFDYILRYVPQKLDLDSKLKPFIPDFIPAVGDIDAFIKVESDNPLQLGLTVLDEPTAKQSDPNIMELQLRSLSKSSSARLSKVKKVVNIDKDSKVVEKWILDIDSLHRSKPPPTVQYSRQMPDVDQLMAEWPHQLQTLINQAGVPSAALDVSLESYVDIICALLDIPIYKSRIQVRTYNNAPSTLLNSLQALHVFFNLFSAFKQSEHFGHFTSAQEQVIS